MTTPTFPTLPADLWSAVLSYCCLHDLLTCRSVSHPLHAAFYNDGAYAPGLAWDLDSVEVQELFTEALLHHPQALRCIEVLHIDANPKPIGSGFPVLSVCEQLLAAWLAANDGVSQPPVLRAEWLSFPCIGGVTAPQFRIISQLRGLRCITAGTRIGLHSTNVKVRGSATLRFSTTTPLSTLST